jgi:hypothetical protein
VTNDIRLSARTVVAALVLGVTLSGCAAEIPDKPYAFKHSIFGEDPVPMTPDKMTMTEVGSQ